MRVEIEPHFPITVERRYDPITGQTELTTSQSGLRGDLLIIHGGQQLLIDISVRRANTLTYMQRGSAEQGSHVKPLVAAAAAEREKHAKYDAECAKHGWKLVVFAMESVGAKGKEATWLLRHRAAHAADLTPSAFLTHADKLLSVTLQRGNAEVARRGSADMLHANLKQHRLHLTPRPTRSAKANSNNSSSGGSSLSSQLASIVHAQLHSARIGARIIAAG